MKIISRKEFLDRKAKGLSAKRCKNNWYAMEVHDEVKKVPVKRFRSYK